MSVKKTMITSLIAVGIGMPWLAQASDLTITNATRRDSTVVADGGACSTILGSVGVTKAGTPENPTVNVVPESKVKLACLSSTRKKIDCQADVYMTNNCSGPIVATVYFDIVNGSGIKLNKSTVFDKSYSIARSSGYTVYIEGGPAKLADSK